VDPNGALTLIKSFNVGQSRRFQGVNITASCNLVYIEAVPAERGCLRKSYYTYTPHWRWDSLLGKASVSKNGRLEIPEL